MMQFGITSLHLHQAYESLIHIRLFIKHVVFTEKNHKVTVFHIFFSNGSTL